LENQIEKHEKNNLPTYIEYNQLFCYKYSSLQHVVETLHDLGI